MMHNRAMIRRLLSRFAAAGALFLMVACETAPVVVEDLPPPDSVASHELLVLPLAGLSPTVGQALGEKMAWGMREAGYPARSASLSNDANPILTGWIEEASDGESDVIWLNINWAVYQAGGTLLGNHRQEMAVSSNGWARLSPDTLAVIVAQAVPAIHEMVEVEIFPDGMPEAEVAYQETGEISLTPPKQETIVVSGEGLSRIDASGNETLDAPLSLEGEPTFAPAYDAELAAEEEFPDGFASGSPLPSMDEISALPEGNEETAATGPPEPLDDVDLLTPESAALVTTTPELTINETIDPMLDTMNAADAMVDESLMELGLEPEDVAQAPGMQQLAAGTVSTAPETLESQPVAGSTAAPQPALADGNANLGFVRPVFLVRHVTGAPGDGNLALRTAMLQSLRAADAMVTDNPTQASYVLQGSVQIAAPFAGRQHARIIWLVTTIMGEEVGTAVQENDVPQGSLNGKWGAVAQAVTDGAINGIAQLFDTRLDAGTAQGNLAQPDLPHVIGDSQP